MASSPRFIRRWRCFGDDAVRTGQTDEKVACKLSEEANRANIKTVYFLLEMHTVLFNVEPFPDA